MRLARALWVLPAALLMTLARSAALAAQQACPEGAIAVVFIDNHSIFDADDLAQDRPVRWGYRVANAVHMRTGASFVRSELLFEEGDCYDPTLLEESERLLQPVHVHAGCCSPTARGTWWWTPRTSGPPR